jgi:DNA-binding LacI/PurR family transcriptional regulator
MELVDFVPSAAARSLRRQRAMVVGLAVRHVDYFATANDPFFALLFTGLAKVFSPAGYGLQVLETNAQAAEKRTGTYYLEKVRERSVDALVIADSAMADKEIVALQQYGTPFVLVNDLVEKFAGRCVVADDEAKGNALARALLERGHRRLGFFGHSADWVETKLALKGMRGAAGAYGVEVGAEDVLLIQSMTEAEQARAMVEILGRGDGPTGVVCGSDDLTGRVGQLLHRGAKVAEGFEFAGQRLQAEQIVRPEFICAVKPVNRAMGIAAAHLLLGLMAGEGEREEPLVVPMGAVSWPSCEMATYGLSK